MDTNPFNDRVFLKLKSLFSDLQVAANFFKAYHLPPITFKDWLSGKHDFSVVEIKMIESFFGLRLKRPIIISHSSPKEELSAEQQTDIIYNTVQHAGEPLLLNDIYQTILTTHADFKWDRLKIYKVLWKDDRIGHFNLNKKKWYGIKEFEQDGKRKKEKVHRIVYDYLVKQSGPVHLSEIKKYVSGYHDVDEHTLKLMIKVELKDRCFHLHGDYYEIRSL